MFLNQIKDPAIDIVEFEDFISDASKDFLRAASAEKLKELHEYIRIDGTFVRAPFQIHARRTNDDLAFHMIDMVDPEILDLEGFDKRKYQNFVREAFNSMGKIGSALDVNNVDFDLMVTDPSNEYTWHLDGMELADYVGIETVIGHPTIYIPGQAPSAAILNEQTIKHDHMKYARSARPGVMSIWRGITSGEQPLLHSTPPAWIDPNYRLLMSLRIYGQRSPY